MSLHPIRYNMQREQGVVVVVALFVVALVAMMASVMMTRLARDTQRTSLILHQIQANDYAYGALLLAVEPLRSNQSLTTLKPRVMREGEYRISAKMLPQTEADTFLFITEVVVDEQRVVWHTKFKRQIDADKKVVLKMIWQRQGERHAG